jgi:hypothetical protein
MLPATLRAGQRAVVRVETEGGMPGIYFIAIDASSSGMTQRLELALVLE